MPNFYGDMDDAINAGDPSDRVFAWWVLDGESAVRAAASPLGSVDPETFVNAQVIATPDDIVSLRRSDPAAALEWRLRVREQFLEALGAGLVVVGLDSEGSYVLAEGSVRDH